MAVIRRPAKMIESGVQPQRSVGEVLLEEAGRAGIGIVGGLAQAALQPVVTSLGPEGSIGRDFVSPEIREMKRREAESMAAARVAPYYAQQQATQRTGMSEAAKTQRTGMGLEGAMEQKQLGEGSDILQLAMKLQGQKDYLTLQYRLRNAAKRAKRPSGMGKEAWSRFKEISGMLVSSTKNKMVDEGVRKMGEAALLQWAMDYPEHQAWLNAAGLIGEKTMKIPSVEVSPNVELEEQVRGNIAELKSETELELQKLEEANTDLSFGIGDQIKAAKTELDTLKAEQENLLMSGGDISSLQPRYQSLMTRIKNLGKDQTSSQQNAQPAGSDAMDSFIESLAPQGK